MKRYKRVLGVLGGMGPEATASFYQNIAKRCQKRFGAKYNSDFPHVIINSYPVPDGRMWEGFDKKKVVSGLRKNARLLEKSGVDFIVLPCNSVHGFIKEVRGAVNVPVMSIAEETAKKVQEKGVKRVTVFGTHFTLSQRVYGKVLEEKGIQVIQSNKKQQKKIDEVIIRVEGGQRLKKDRDALAKIAANMKKQGARGVILGCTELPLLIRKKDVDMRLFDTIEILADSTFKKLV